MILLILTSSDYRIALSSALSLSRSRCFSASALLASQLPSQSEWVLLGQGKFSLQKVQELAFLFSFLVTKFVRVSPHIIAKL